MISSIFQNFLLVSKQWMPNKMHISMLPVNIYCNHSSKQLMKWRNKKTLDICFKHFTTTAKNKPLKFSQNVSSKSKQEYHSKSETEKVRNRTVLYYISAFTVLVAGLTYAAVPLYRIYCQATGKGGQAVQEDVSEKVSKMKKVKSRTITVNFNADTNARMLWNFVPQQPNITVSPGETALAFYTAKNPSNVPITGIATYNVLPYEAGKYFNKIQCFCFEEQILNPNEEVDMPVFFYLDPEFAEDPKLENVNDIVLSYTFFEAKEGLKLPMPSYK